MRPLTGKALARAFFGPRYGRGARRLLVPVLLFAAVWGAQITLPGPVEAAALCTAFSAGAMVQTLGDRRHLEELEELFLLPMPDRWFALCYGTVLAAHTLFTRTLPLWALLAALCPGRPGELAAALVWSAGACWGCAAGYGLFRRGRWIPVLLWGAGAAAVVVLGSLPVQLAGAAVSAGVAGVCLCRLGPWEFQRLAPARGPRRRRSGGVLGYLFRALSADRRSWLNTAGLWAGACLLPLALAPASGRELLPVSLALCGLNTPAATLFSRDPALAQALVVLPGGGRRFWRGYVGFLAALYGAALVLCLGGGGSGGPGGRPPPGPAGGPAGGGPGAVASPPEVEDRERPVAPPPEVPGPPGSAAAGPGRGGPAGGPVPLGRRPGPSGGPLFPGGGGERLRGKTSNRRALPGGRTRR